MLRDLNLAMRYRSSTHNLLRDFYVPCLGAAVRYDRAVGFFSSYALSAAAAGLPSFIGANGQMRLIASPELSPEDVAAIREGYRTREAVVEEALVRVLERDYPDPVRERLSFLAWMVAEGQLEIKIAIVSDEDEIGIYHEKTGVFEDSGGDRVGFEGSANESYGGLVANFEAISVYRSWVPEDQERLAFVADDFERLWDDTTPNLAVYQFPEAARRSLLRLRPVRRPSRNPDLPSPEEVPGSAGLAPPAALELRDYQTEAIEAWMKAGGRGIFAMATGTGKTLTALSLATRLARAALEANGSLFLLVLCPYQHLVTQWADDARAFGMNPILCFRSRLAWQDDLAAAIGDVARGYTPFTAAISTYATFQTEAFQEVLARAPSHSLLVADEVHNIGAVRLRACLPDQVRYRLGLSATPERWLDETGTSAIAAYFGPIVYEIDIDEAIRRGALTPYEYYPVAVDLEDEEIEVYLDLTEQIARLVGDGPIDWSDESDNLQLKQLLIRRARLLATAQHKLAALEEIMSERRETSFNLVYCGDGRVEDPLSGDEVRQVDAVAKLLGRKLGMSVNSYTAETSVEEREDLRARFGAGSLQALVAIRCLDEGVDIPETRNAFILASSSNPRQFIQRRGRVLRLSPETGKTKSAIWDFVVTPPADVISSDTRRVERRLVGGELRRVALFARAALNGPQAMAALNEIRDRYHLLHIG